MKIRIEDNSVRYRLRRSEVDTLTEKGSLWATVNFPEGQFTYGLQAIEGLADLQAVYEDGSIIIQIPKQWVKTWPGSPQIGFETDLKWNGVTLHLLIEKDFVCLDRDIASQSDQYPNPKA